MAREIVVGIGQDLKEYVDDGVTKVIVQTIFL